MHGSDSILVIKLKQRNYSEEHLADGKAVVKYNRIHLTQDLGTWRCVVCAVMNLQPS